ncbi:hypothetical protein F511_28736 [Dorcoceras hygrometricum]|uniref:Uncharacterized protein n=1 Tax=Dorcoceras hygrometricum TaxID=472368 RepID=A0A2Z7C3S8_9LAMI|nr:hypothetical protein F511_28736 [Dorcoceras hygrometricum]
MRAGRAWWPAMASGHAKSLRGGAQPVRPDGRMLAAGGAAVGAARPRIMRPTRCGQPCAIVARRRTADAALDAACVRLLPHAICWRRAPLSGVSPSSVQRLIFLLGMFRPVPGSP